MECDGFENIAELWVMLSAASIIYHWRETGEPESGGLMQKWSTHEPCHVCFCFEGYYPRKRTL